MAAGSTDGNVGKVMGVTDLQLELSGAATGAPRAGTAATGTTGCVATGAAIATGFWKGGRATLTGVTAGVVVGATVEDRKDVEEDTPV